MEKIIKALQSLVLSVKAHPDYDPNGGEFYDLVSIAEKALNNQPSPLISNGATQEEQARKILQGYKCSSHSDQNFIEESVIEAMLEYASLQSSQALAKQRNEVIEECKSCFSEVFKISPEVDNILKIVEAFKEGFYKLEKIKSTK